MMESLIDSFVSAPGADEKRAAITALIKNRSLNRALRDPAFESGLQSLARSAGDAQLTKERLVALAALSRIARVARPFRAKLRDLLAPNLVQPLPPLWLLTNPDDRLYAASAWRFASQDWWRAYLASAAIEEDSAERVRLECLEGLMTLSPSMGFALKELHPPLSRVRLETENPADSMGRRLRRVLESLLKAVVKVRSDPDQQSGIDLAQAIQIAFRRTGQPRDPAILSELTEVAAALTHEIVRARFSLAARSDTYASIDIVRPWFDSHDWEAFSTESKTCALLARDITEALRLLVQAGVTDDRLFEKLVQTLGSIERARSAMRQLAAELPAIPDAIQDWLLGRPTRKTSLLAAESQERATDEIIADLWIDTSVLSLLLKKSKEQLVLELNVVAPRLSESLRELLGLCETVVNTLSLLAQRRALRVRGTIGEELDFSPLEHEMIGGLQPGRRRVRLVRALVESINQDGTTRIIRKGLVEALKSAEKEGG